MGNSRNVATNAVFRVERVPPEAKTGGTITPEEDARIQALLTRGKAPTSERQVDASQGMRRLVVDEALLSRVSKAAGVTPAIAQRVLTALHEVQETQGA